MGGICLSTTALDITGMYLRWGPRASDGVNGAGCSTFLALIFKATMWPGVRADPAPGSQAQAGCTWGPAMHVFTFSEEEGRTVSALALWGIWNLITQLLLFFVLTTTFLHPTGKYLSHEFHLTCASIKGKSPVTASEQFTLIPRSSHLWSLTSFVFLDLFEKYILAYPKY